MKAGFFRLAKYNAPEWPYFILGGLGSAVLGLVMPAFALVGPHAHPPEMLVASEEARDDSCAITLSSVGAATTAGDRVSSSSVRGRDSRAQEMPESLWLPITRARRACGVTQQQLRG